MTRLVIDSNVIGRAATAGQSPDTRQSWNLLECIRVSGHRMVVCPKLWQEYQAIPQTLQGRDWLAHYAFAVMEPVNNPPNGVREQEMTALGVDAKDATFVLLAADAQVPFTTWEKFTDGRRADQSKEQRHREVADAVRDRYAVDIWDPPYALRRLNCPK